MSRPDPNPCNITLNSPANGVFLPGCGASGAIGMIHCGKHTAAYENAVWDRLRGKNREQILNELDDIRRELLSGNFLPLNVRSLVD